IVQLRNGKVENAVFHFREALRLKPDYAQAYNSLGAALVLTGKTDEAVFNFKKALQIKPDYLEPKDNLDRLSASKKK
ncbi:MAG: tetratricopeptide repeat protein, partial [Desulfobacterales bacterium]